ncbi:hypothetical protein NP233_g7419 [Leucocoprinus birnbaumii]|uniref:Cryptic loci regulator 2 N-terminal domain-containing protein n=1 Tax=Leucocoprinus birnbaumii TaxID=56174 RepID=A0AAD5VPA7_9AGAR|nr:hypothetical protein NP233_g7419 [Leucocoprinus birnbaumii]
MARRVGQPNVVFGPSTEFLDFPRSDGDPSRWPTNTTRVVDSDKQVNFMEALDIEGSGQARKWRAAVGRAVASKLGMQDSDKYVLRGWPAGYQMYDHHKGPAGNPRHDLYLYGYRSGRFRSINEFVPHAIWLFSDATLNNMNCECKYCTKQPQKGITASMGDILGSSASPAPRVQREKGKDKKTATRPYASTQRILRPALKPSSRIQDSPTLAERNSDLRAVFSRNSMELRRWYRDGEIVWCRLSAPILGPSGDDSNIVFWPGLVEECKLKAVPIPREVPPSASNPPNPIPGPSSTSSSAHEEGRGTVYEKTDQTPFTVQQSMLYSVELFAVNKTIRLPDREVIPYPAYLPPDEVIASMQDTDPEHLNFDRDSVSDFNPCPVESDPPLFSDAVGPYAVALQIASNVSQFFSVTDEWEFTYHVPAPSRVPAPPKTPRPDSSLSEVINDAGRMNSESMAAVQSSHDRSFSGVRPGMSQSTLRQLANDMLGQSPGPKEVMRTQIRFQGLWWGPERIWVDDFVRLKVQRQCLAPNGSQDILPPAGPSKKAIDNYKSTGRDISEIGAGTRGVFMQINALFVVELMTTDGRKRKECRASGPLFELVDDDWDENEDVAFKEYNSRSQPSAETARPTKPLPTRALSSSTSQPPPVTRPTPAPSASTSALPVHQTQPPAASSSSITPTKQTTPPAPPAPYLPPQPPLGYRFRPIVAPGHEAVISLSLLEGRYYPGILMHPLLATEIHRASRIALEDGGVLRCGHIWALDGLNGGYHCSVDPDKFQSSRQKMLERADKEAYILLDAFKQDMRLKTEQEEQDVDMLARDGDEMNEGEHDRMHNGFGMDKDGDVTMQ